MQKKLNKQLEGFVIYFSMKKLSSYQNVAFLPIDWVIRMTTNV